MYIHISNTSQEEIAFIDYMNMINIPYIINENYGLKEFTKNVINDLDNRCLNYCYRVRLEETVKYAKENGYDAFTSTLFLLALIKNMML